MAQNEPHSDAEEKAALYLSGALTDDERRAVEAEIASGDGPLARAVTELDAVTSTLAHLVDPIAPRAETRDAVLDAVDLDTNSSQQVWRGWKDTPTDELFTLAADAGGWEPTGVEGIEVRRLFVDRPANRMTAMFRMAPGAEYVPHVHDGAEECYVLQGDLHVGDVVLRAGDYQRAPAGSTHGVQWTENGCVLLISSSLSDEVI